MDCSPTEEIKQELSKYSSAFQKDCFEINEIRDVNELTDLISKYSNNCPLYRIKAMKITHGRKPKTRS